MRQPEFQNDFTDGTATALNRFDECHPPCSIVAALDWFDCPRSDVSPVRFGTSRSDQFYFTLGPFNNGTRGWLRNRLQHLRDDPLSGGHLCIGGGGGFGARGHGAGG